MAWDFEVRQQFIIPTTPIQTYPGSDLRCVDSLGDQYSSSTVEDGDSYYHTYNVTEGPGSIILQFHINVGNLPDVTDYFVCTADPGPGNREVQAQVTKFVDLVPYPSWRVRVDLSRYPYSKALVAPISDKSDVEDVTFTETLPYTETRFGTAPLTWHYFYLKLFAYSPAIVGRNWDILKIFPTIEQLSPIKH